MILVERKTLPWALASGLMLVAAVAAYVVAVRRAPPGGPSGGTWFGLAFGLASTAMLVAALLLGARKRLRTWRVGRAYVWMQLHVWLGLFCYPLAYFHAGGLRWGTIGSLTWVIMVLFSIVWVSGIVGLVIQQVVPRLMLERLPGEVTYEQHDHVLDLMRVEANRSAVAVAIGPEGIRTDVDAVPAGAAIPSPLAVMNTAAGRLTSFHQAHVAPFLDRRPAGGLILRRRGTSRQLFAELRAELPPTMHGAVDDLETLVEERRQMLVQADMQRVLHGWLFVHVPLSYALAALVALHAVFAVRYIGG